MRCIERWNLKKKNPDARISEPVEPIVFWIDNAVPAEFRDAIAEGIEFWNTSFEKIGFRSAEKSFVRPFEYAAGAGELSVNIGHQAAAYQAVLESFSEAGFPWYRGIVLWDASVSPDLHGAGDAGFSPLGKTQSEEVIKRFFRGP